MAALLQLYNATPFTSGSLVYPIDVYVGDGSTKTFTLLEKSGIQLGGVIQADAVKYDKEAGGFTISGNTFTLETAPPMGAMIVAPGVRQLVWSAYDQDPITGITNPRICETPFWIADVTTIGLYTYTASPTQSGIIISIDDEITATAPTASWIQFAPANPDTLGTPGTYGSAGASISTTDISALNNVMGSPSMGDTSWNLYDATGFLAGDYIFINPGGINQEQTRILSIVSNTVTTYGLEFAHSDSELVYVCGRKFWAKMTVPLNANGGVPVTLYDLALVLEGRQISRV